MPPIICFLRGTRLATPQGETAVEELQVGDLVATRLDGDTVTRPVIWIGRRGMDIRNSHDEIDAYPVRIRAHAFADNVPHRDLLVTSDHCIFVDGKLIPSRMLANGGSIIVDASITQYEYFHVELEKHAILIAEGLETESYLDTGNRGNFANADVASLTPDFTVDAAHKSWERDAAAPLAVDRETVEPIWRRLADRARVLGLESRKPDVELVSEPDMRLVTEAGLEIAPTRVEGKLYSFAVPDGAGALRLVSRASRPSEIIGPYVDDRRPLGVLVGEIGLDVSGRRVAAEMDLAGTVSDDGWYPPDAGAAYRWTNGNALLPLDLSVSTGRSMLVTVEVVHAGPYLAAIAA